MIDIDAIGAGGGSIAYIDPGARSRVGPRSAGPEPGPACYQGAATSPNGHRRASGARRLDAGAFLAATSRSTPVAVGKGDRQQNIAEPLNGRSTRPRLAFLKIVNNKHGAGDQRQLRRQGHRPRPGTSR